MKKIISAFVAFLFLISCFTVIAYADTSSSVSENENINSQKDAVKYTCSYSEDGKSIAIHGTVNYDTLVTYGKYILEVYKIGREESIDSVIASKAAVASTSLTVKFDITISITDPMDRLCKYAILLKSPEGKHVLAATPRYATAASKYNTATDMRSFKGIYASSNDSMSVYGDVGFGTAIVPVYYNKLKSVSSSGYVFSYEGETHYFDKDYIDSLDKKIRTYSASGARVYLQLLLPSDAVESSVHIPSEVNYCMPNIASNDVALNISTYVRFLAIRYENYCDGQIGGIILGKDIDVFADNYTADTIDINEYAEIYSYYLMLVANTARHENPDIDIVVPISNFNSYGNNEPIAEGRYYPSKLLEAISAELDRSIGENFKYSVMLTADLSPISLEGYGDKKYSFITNGSYINVNTLKEYESFVANLQKKYVNAPMGHIYLWQISESTAGNELAVSYVYSYYKLFSSNNAFSFAVSFDGCTLEAFEQIAKTVKYIDTEKGIDICNGLLEVLGVSSWNEIVSIPEKEKLILRSVYETQGEIEINKTGVFSYFDFSAGDINYWWGTSNSVLIKSDREADGKRALKQVISKPQGALHSDLLCMYEYEENFSYTPVLMFELKIDDGENKGALYEIGINIGTQGTSVEKKFTVRSGEVNELWLDMREFNKNNAAKYIKISTRSINGTADQYSLWLYDISGYSDLYDNDNLRELIEAERLKIRDLVSADTDSETDLAVYWVILAVIIIVVLAASIAFIVLRRDDSDKKVKRIRDRSDKK